MHDLGSFPDAHCTKAHVFSLCGNNMPSERVWDTRPVLGHVILSARLPLRRERCCRHSVEARKPRERTVKKSCLVPWWRLQTGLLGCSREPSARQCLPHVLGRGGAHQSQGEAAPHGPAELQEPLYSCSSTTYWQQLQTDKKCSVLVPSTCNWH